MKREGLNMKRYWATCMPFMKSKIGQKHACLVCRSDNLETAMKAGRKAVRNGETKFVIIFDESKRDEYEKQKAMLNTGRLLSKPEPMSHILHVFALDDSKVLKKIENMVKDYPTTLIKI